MKAYFINDDGVITNVIVVESEAQATELGATVCGNYFGVGDTLETAEARRLQNVGNQVRQKRNKLLAATDWWVLTDSPEATPEELAYRQALRDITDQEGFPDSVTFPEKPID